MRSQGKYHHVQYIWVHDATDANPRNVEEDRDQFHSDTNKTWDIEFPRWKPLFVEYTSCDEEPRIQLDAHTYTHEESELWHVMRDNQV